MKNRMGIWAAGLATAAVMLPASGWAQNVPAQFVETGKDAVTLRDFNHINIATAEKIANTCIDLATKHGVGVSVVILDVNGDFVYLKRMDGQGHTNVSTAVMKAETALKLRAPTHLRENIVKKDPALYSHEVQLGYFPTAGGLPIIVNDQLIGAIGVGGSQPNAPVWSDEICARNAMEIVLGPQPPLVQDYKPGG